MNRVDEYVRQVLEVAGLPARHEQGEEIRAHLSDLIAARVDGGLPVNQAVQESLTEFGSAQTVGRRLREVTPLRLTGREWIVVSVAALFAGGGLWADQYWMLGDRWSWFDWLLFVPVISGCAGMTVRRFLVAALSPLAGLYVANLIMGHIGWFRGHSGRMVTFYDLNKVEHPVALLGQTTFPSGMDALAVLALVAACLAAGWVGAKLRGAPVRAEATRVLSAAAHLAPFGVLFGLSWGSAGVLVCAALWFWLEDRSVFLRRHLAQGVVVGAGAVVTQVIAYQVIGQSWNQWPGYFSPLWYLALGLMTVRRVFGALAVWASLSALMGHDFRYPLVSHIFQGGMWRWLRRV